MSDRPTRAVVLGGGGLTGIAWLTGVIATLQRAGIALADADLILGTSAGSVVGAQLAAGRDLGRLDRFLGNERVPARSALLRVYGTLPKPDAPAVARLAETWHDAGPTSAEQRARAGAAALRAATMPERAYVALIHAFLLLRRWPGPAFGVTAVDALDGTIRIVREDDRVPIARAVAASTAVPQVFPPVHLDGRPYVDGGTGSATNAALAAGHDVVLVFVDHCPGPTGAGPLSRTALDVELAALRESGARVVVIEPDADASAAIGGVGGLDPARIQPCARAGRRQGHAEIERVRAAWAP